jgi:hypothetical protein
MAMKNKRLYLMLFFFLVPLSVILTQCFNAAKSADPRGQNYAGSKACIKCHKEIYDGYINTPHNISSRQASIHNIHGSFLKGQNIFNFSDSLKVVMQKRAGGVYQVAYKNGKAMQSQRFDIVFGGVKAETYLYWKNDGLFELPISYFENLHNWTNSPGYAGGIVNYTRPIVTRCFECHSSYISEKEGQPQSLSNSTEFDRSSIILGIDCERCHGPSAQHVTFHTEHPEEKRATFITSFNSLTRAQKLDACAVCHSGNKDRYLASTFSFKIGDTLAKFKEPDFFRQEPKPATIDVHGNQNGLLAASKCFLMSNMDCSTCHNTHNNKKPDLITYAANCSNCHKSANHNQCKLKEQLGGNLITNCIDCHMPAKPSDVIKVESEAGKMIVPYLVRTHNIAIYPQETKKILAFINSGNKQRN